MSAGDRIDAPRHAGAGVTASDRTDRQPGDRPSEPAGSSTSGANGSAERWVRRPAGITTERALRSTTRAGIYEHLRRSGSGQTVRDVAQAFRLHPNVARTHLETLADAGLVVVSSRKHPGGGRPAKVYLARPEAGDDEVHLRAPTGASPSTAVIRMLAEVIVQGQGTQNGALETLRQVATKHGARLTDRIDTQPTTLHDGADLVVRVLRDEGYVATVEEHADDTAFIGRIGGVLDALRDLQTVRSAVEWGLLTGAFTKVWRAVHVSPVAELPRSGQPGWAVRAASASASANRLLVTIAGRVDARNAPRETGVVRAMRAITALESGAVLEVLAGGPGSPAAFARWADRAGHELIGVERASGDDGRTAIRLLIRKGRA